MQREETVLTAVVWDRQDAAQVMCVNLREYGETGQWASPAGDVQRRVSALIHRTRVTAGFQQLLHDMRLLHDDSQVERGLGKHTAKRNTFSRDILSLLH